MMLKTAALATVLLLGPIPALAEAPMVNPMFLFLGGPSVHLTPRTDSGIAIPIGQCEVKGVPPTLASVSYDATGAVLSAVGTGSTTLAYWQCVNQGTTAVSVYFKVLVPWTQGGIGDTSP